LGSKSIKRTPATVRCTPGIHISESINRLEPVAPEEQPKFLTAKTGVRWKKLQEWPKEKVVSHSAEWNSVFGEPKTVVACSCGCYLPRALRNASSALSGESSFRVHLSSPCPQHSATSAAGHFTVRPPLGTPQMPYATPGHHTDCVRRLYILPIPLFMPALEPTCPSHLSLSTTSYVSG
jgi:hypothetical protein